MHPGDIVRLSNRSPFRNQIFYSNDGVSDNIIKRLYYGVVGAILNNGIECILFVGPYQEIYSVNDLQVVCTNTSRVDGNYWRNNRSFYYDDILDFSIEPSGPETPKNDLWNHWLDLCSGIINIEDYKTLISSSLDPRVRTVHNNIINEERLFRTMSPPRLGPLTYRQADEVVSVSPTTSPTTTYTTPYMMNEVIERFSQRYSGVEPEERVEPEELNLPSGFEVVDEPEVGPLRINSLDAGRRRSSEERFNGPGANEEYEDANL